MPAPLVGDGLLPQPVRISGFEVWDGTTIIVALQTQSEGLRAKVYREFANGTLQVIGSTSGLAKDDSAFAVVKQNGDVVLYVSEADDGQSGTTAKVRKYTWPSVFPARPLTDITFVYNLVRTIQQKLGLAANA